MMYILPHIWFEDAVDINNFLLLVQIHFSKHVNSVNFNGVFDHSQCQYYVLNQYFQPVGFKVE